jgi:hypothetical protein
LFNFNPTLSPHQQIHNCTMATNHPVGIKTKISFW